MTRYFFIIILQFLFGLSAIGQDYYQLRWALDFIQLNEKIHGGQNKSLSGEYIKGSPYLNNEFVTGTVFTTSKIQYKGLSLNFNVYNDQIEFVGRDNQILEIVEPELIEKIEYGDIRIVYDEYIVSDDLKKGFFIEERSGQASLYRKPKVIFEPATQAAALVNAKPARFKRLRDEFYIKIGQTPAKLVSSKKDLPKIFSEYHEELESFIKKNKIKPNNVDDLNELLKYYTSL